MKYNKLGKLPIETVNFFLEEILKRKQPNIDYQWIHFDEYLNDKFLQIFTNTELKIQYSENKNRPVQKAFYSEPGHGYRIHKDGFKCQSALNIAVSCNPGDWVRWYDDEYIDSISTLEYSNKLGKSRNTNIYEYENVPFIEELRNAPGDVYVLDVGSYHSFKCLGNSPRIVIQTKFDGFPNLPTINQSLVKNSFSNIINLQ
jgi:hypothetical protein